MHIPHLVSATRVGLLSTHAKVWRLGLALVLAFGWLVLPTPAQAQFCTEPMTVDDPTKIKKAKKKDGDSVSIASCPEPWNPEPEPPPPSEVKGVIDGLSGNTIVGWACSTGINSSIDVHLYVGGAAGSGTGVGAYRAESASEPAVASACQASGTAYRFGIPITTAMVTQHGGKTIYIHGISPVGGAHNLLSQSGTFRLPTNQPPSVSLTSPAAGTVVQAPGSFALQANASDADDGVASLTFYANGVALHTDTVAPYAYSWSNVSAGTYNLQAVARDTRGATATSDSVSVSVTAPPPPSQVKGDIEGISGNAIVGWACSTGINDSIGVHLYLGGPAGTGVYAAAVTANQPSEPAVAAGCQAQGTQYRFAIPITTAMVTEHANKTIYIHGLSPVGQSNLLISRSGDFRIPANALPTITLTSPANGATGTAPAAFVLRASAADSDDGVVSVTFHANGQAVNTDTAAPYEFNWTGVGVGAYSIYAVVRDTRGAAATSGSVSVSVAAPPPPSTVGPGTISRQYVYDQHQQLCKVIEPETRATVMDYDAAGNLQWSAAGLELMGTGTAQCDTIAARDSGRKVTRYYDNRNRLQSLRFPDGKGDQDWSYTPDGLPSQIITHNDGIDAALVVNTYTYNRRRLLIGESVTQPGWYSWGIGYGYDANGSLAVQTYPTGLSVDYAPNALGQPTRAGSFAHDVSYHPNGAIRQFSYGNGVTHTMQQNARQLPARSTDLSVLDFTFRYDRNGNTTNIDDVNQVAGQYSGSRDMQYDGLDRLTYAHLHWWQINNFGYDALDNIRSKSHFNGSTTVKHSYWYDATNRLTNVADDSDATVTGLAYDVQGNLQNKNGQIYHFDYGNRLREATGKEHYRYDGHGRRVLAWSPTQSSILSHYSRSGQVVFQEDHRKPGIDAQEHIYLAGSLVATRHRNYASGAIATKYQHTDALGSPVAVTNEAGQVLERTHYEPFGATINKSFNGVGYTGHVMDAATGLTYMQQRYYDPTLGRFLSVDPVTADGNTGGNFNRYWYANNNPYMFTDPDGRRAKEAFRERVEGGGAGAGSQANSASPSTANGRYSSGAIYSSRSSASEAASHHQTDLAGGSWQKALFGSGHLTFLYDEGDSFGYILQPYQGGIAPAFGGAGGVSNSRLLSRALQGGGFIRPVGSAAHHIVAGNARGAAAARAVLQRFGIGINEISNGVYLPAAAHRSLHTNAYYNTVNSALGQATTRQEALQVLSSIRQGLASGNFP